MAGPRPTLAERLGVEVPAGLAGELAERFEASRARSLETLIAQEAVPREPEARLVALAMPPSVLEVLTVAVADARRRGLVEHERALLLTHVESLPYARLAQLASARAPNRWLFHEPVAWEAMPRFGAALERLFALVRAHDLDPAVLGAKDAAAWRAARPTLATAYLETYYGRLLPLFGAGEQDLARLADEVASQSSSSSSSSSASRSRWEVVDHRLGHALIHELLHFAPGREAIFPPYLDEAIAAHLQLLVDEEVAFPAPGDDAALIGWPWFSQVGAALARAVGDGPLLAAQAGVRAWHEVIPEPLLTRLERDTWAAYQAAPAVHFHPDTTRPDRWVRLVYELAPPRHDDAERDRRMLVHALTATCLHATQHDGAWRVTRRAPAGRVTIDFAAGVVRAPPRRDGGYEPAPMIHALPPSLIGHPGSPLVLVLDPDPGAIAATAARIMAEIARGAA